MSGDAHADGPWLDPEEAAGGLLLFPPARPGPSFADELAAALATRAVGAFVAGPAGSAVWRLARERCRDAGVACLAFDDPALAEALGADGVHLADPALVAAARRRLGPEAVVGAACGGSRHAAMVAGEDGADYVMFSPGLESLPELCAWWGELFVLPCAADLRADSGDPEAPARAGADFLAVGDAVWSHPEGAAAAVLELRRRMDAARAERGQGPE